MCHLCCFENLNTMKVHTTKPDSQCVVHVHAVVPLPLHHRHLFSTIHWLMGHCIQNHLVCDQSGWTVMEILADIWPVADTYQCLFDRIHFYGNWLL